MNTYGIFSTLRLAAAFRATLARLSQRPWLALSLLLGVVCAGQAQAAITVRLTNSTYAVYQSLHPAETKAAIIILRYNSPSDGVNAYTNSHYYEYSGNITNQNIGFPFGTGYYRAIYYKGNASQANPNCSISPWSSGTAVFASDGSTVDLTAVCVPPDLTPPTVQSAATSSDGLSVDVTFSENIDYWGDGSDFSLTVNGVNRAITGASFSDDVLTLTVSPAIAAGTTVLLSYSNEGNLYDLAFNEAASFSNQPVTNNVAASDPTATISVSPASVAEDGAPNLVYTVTLSAPAASNTSVAYTVTGTATSGVDYAAVTSPVVITTGNSSATITVNPTADATIEADETAIITLNAGAGYVVGAPSSATGTILNDDLPNLSINDVTLSEGNSGTTSANFTVSLSSPAGPGGVTFDIATANGTASAGSDYVASSLTSQTISSGNSSYNFSVTLNGDVLNEPSETFFVNVTNVSNAVVVDGQGVGTIVNDDPLPSLSVDDVSVVEGHSGSTNASFTVSLNAASGQTVTVNYATADGTAAAPADYTSTSGTLTFTAGQTSKTVNVAVNGDTSVESSETFALNLSGASNATIADNSGTATITNDDVAIVFDPATLTNGALQAAYSQQLSASGATAPYSYSISAGSLPTGLSLSAAGLLSGTPSAVGPFNFTVSVTDSSPFPGPYSASTSYSLTIDAVAPDAPTIGTVTAGDGQASVAFTPPANDGGSAITSYTVTSSPSGFTGTGGSSPIVVTGLSNGTAYTFTVTATNAIGTSAASSASGSATPMGNQSITFADPGAQNFGTTPTLTATASSGLDVTFSSATPAVCTITSEGALTFVSAGTCTINADQAGDGSWNAATQVSRSFSVNAVVAGAPTIGTATAGNAQATISFTAPASNGGSAITGYTVTSNPSGLTATGASSPISVTGLTNGTAYTFTVTATNAAGTSAASAASNAVTPAAPQTITFANPGLQSFGTSPTLTASADSGLSVTFSSSTPAVCTLNGATLTFVTAGTCTITAEQAGNDAYLPASPVSRSFTVEPVVPAAPTSVVATAGNAQASVAFAAPANSGGAMISGYTVTVSPAHVAPVSGAASPIVITGLTNGTAYTFTVTADNAAGTGPASSASSPVTPQAAQTITFNDPGAQDFATSPTLIASADSGLTVSFSSSTPAVCTLSGATLTFVTAGSCTITAEQAGNDAYLPASPVSRSFTVNPIVADAPTAVSATAGDGSATISFTAPASNGGAAISSYTVTASPGGLTASGNGSPIVLSGLTNGVAYTFTVTATNGAGDSAASAASSPVVPMGQQSISFDEPSAQNFGTSPSLSATASSGLPITFSSATPEVCTVSAEGVVTFITTGSCTVHADQSGSANYLAASRVSRTFTINAVAADAPTAVSATAGDGSATISFTAPASNGGAAISSYTVTASPGGLTASGNDSPIVLSGLTNGVAYTFTVTATNGAGDSAASAASSPVVPMGQQSISFDEPSAQNFGTSPSLSATASSGLPITFSSATPEVCTVSAEGVVTFITTGSCTVHADQSGSANYLAASRVSRTFTINAVAADAPTAVSATAGDGSATISFTAPASNGGAAISSYTVTASPGGLTASGNGSPIVLSGLTNGVAYTFTVTATNGAGDSTASAASSPVVPMGQQSISFDEPSAQNFGTSPSLSATASSGLPITFSSATPEVCTVTAEGVVTFIATGSCTIHADQSGSANYLAASRVSRTFTINAVAADAPTAVSATAGDGSATISFTAPASNGGAAISSYTVTASPGGLTASGNGSPIVLSGLTNGVAYTFTVTATNGAGDSTASAPSSPVVPMGQQSISFDEPSAQNFGTSPSLSATASSGLPITFSSATPEVCTVSAEGVVAFITTGSCTVHADQSGSANYLAANRVSRTFTINAVAADAPTAVSATAGDGSATISFTAPASNGGSAISGYRVTASPGGATVTANNAPINISGLQNGTSYSFTVAALNGSGVSGESAPSNSVTPKGEQSISFTSPGEQTAGTSLQLNATTSSGLGLLFSSATPEVCIISASGLLELLAAGQCSITVEQPGNGAWLAAPSQSQSFSVLAANQLPTISGTPATTVTVGEAYLFAPVANDADATDTLTFSISNKPAWASFDSSSGRLSGTPTEDNIGVTNGILISVSDGQASSALPAFSLQVVAVDDSLPQLTPPASVTVNADALFTRLSMRTLLGLAANASDDAVAAALAALASDSTDGNDCCTTAPDGLTASGSLLLPPGRHNVRWVATNSRGDSVSAIQQVNVNPLISLSKSQLALRGSAVEMRVILNGDAPSYPLVVAYAIDDASTATAEEHSLVDGEVRFERAGQLEIAVPIRLSALTGRNDSELIVQLAGVGNFGAQNSHSVGIREGNIAPSVSLQLQQNGVITSLIAADGGRVTATAIVTDANSGDSHSFSWRAANGLSDSDGDESNGSFSFDPAALSGSHQLHVTATDSAGASGESSASFRVVAALPQLSSAQDSDDDGIDDASEGTADSDGNGIPDYLDNMPSSNILPQVGSQTRAYLVECDPGVRCGLGLFALNGNSGGVQIFNEELGSSGQPVIDPAFEPVGGVFDFAIRDLPTPGQSVRVVLPQRAPIPAAAVYRKFRNGSWVTFVEDEANALHSAAGEAGYCPPPGAIDWTPGLTAGHLCVQLTIEDGGANDDDGVVNSAVVDPGAVSSPLAVAPPTNNELNTKGGGSMGLFTVALLALLGWLRRRPQWCALLLAGLLAAGHSQAADLDGFYLRGDLYQAQGSDSASSLNDALAADGIDGSVSYYDVDRVAYQLALGYRWQPWTYTELGYLDLGEVSVNLTVAGDSDEAALRRSLGNNYPAAGDGISLVQGLAYPLAPAWQLAGELGLWAWRGNIDVEGGELQLDYHDNIEPLVGLRLDYQLNQQLGVGLSARRVVFDGQHVDLWGLSASWQF